MPLGGASGGAVTSIDFFENMVHGTRLTQKPPQVVVQIHVLRLNLFNKILVED